MDKLLGLPQVVGEFGSRLNVRPGRIRRPEDEGETDLFAWQIMVMPLFDDFERTENRSGREGEPPFAYLNLSARPASSRRRGSRLRGELRERVVGLIIPRF